MKYECQLSELVVKGPMTDALFSLVRRHEEEIRTAYAALVAFIPSGRWFCSVVEGGVQFTDCISGRVVDGPRLPAVPLLSLSVLVEAVVADFGDGLCEQILGTSQDRWCLACLIADEAKESE